MLNSKIFFIMLKIIIWLIRSNCWGGGGFMVGFFKYYFKLQFIVRFGECIFGKILSGENDNLRWCHNISSSKKQPATEKKSPRKNCNSHEKTLHHGNNSICSQNI